MLNAKWTLDMVLQIKSFLHFKHWTCGCREYRIFVMIYSSLLSSDEYTSFECRQSATFLTYIKKKKDDEKGNVK